MGYDGTLAQQDTVEHLVGLALERAPTEVDRAQAKQQWQQLASQKVQAIESLLDRLPPVAQATWSPLELEQFVSDLEIRERLANRRLVDSGVIAGIAPEDIMLSAASIVPRDGAKDVVGQLCCGAGDFIGAVQIISNNLSGFLIRSSLSRVFLPRRAGVRFRVPRVVANTLEMEGKPRETFEYCGPATGGGGERSTGGIKWSIESSRDKAVCLRTHMYEASMGQSAGGGLVVFVGDSLSDLAALVTADIGIIIAAQDGRVCPTLQRAVQGLGLRDHQLQLREELLEPAAAAGGGGTPALLERLTAQMERGPVLVMADDWDGVGELLLGEDCSECKF